MRLINTATLELEEFPEERAPRYAILSHTWGDEEVNFQDMRGPIEHRQSKKGYDKIVRTCLEAKSSNLEYVWADTCCIDKSSSAELSESINSMFRWYAKAEICYAYLVDVRNNLLPLRNSVWFTRGWTLQELLAPRDLVFFDADWRRIGTRETRSVEVEVATGIKQRYLHPDPTGSGKEGGKEHHEAVQEMLAEASIAQKMSWAANRRTTRVEDVAYCLLGIFGINMPLLYGEGKSAFIRLQEAILQRVFDDQSIFAWEQGSEHNSRILAESPDAFDGCGTIVPCRMRGYDPGLSLTNKGIRLNVPILGRGEFYAVLRCQREDDPLTLLSVPIRLSHADVCVRREGKVRTMAHFAWARLPIKSIYLSTYPMDGMARRAWDRPTVKIRADPGYFSIEDDNVSDDDLRLGYLPLLTDEDEQASVDYGGSVHIRTAKFVLKTTLTNDKFWCHVETYDNLWIQDTAPLVTAQARPPFLMEKVHALDDALGISTQRSDHAVLSHNRVIYTTVQTDDIFGRTVYTVDIKVSWNRLLVQWFLIKDRLPLLRRPQLPWELRAFWASVKISRQVLSSADISNISGFEVTLLLAYMLLYLLVMGPYALALKKILPGFIRSRVNIVWSRFTGAAVDIFSTLWTSLLKDMTADTFSLHFLILVVSSWMVTIAQKRTASVGSRILRLLPLILGSRPFVRGIFSLCRDEHDRFLLQSLLLVILILIWSGVSHVTSAHIGWDLKPGELLGMLKFGEYLMRMTGVGSLICWLASVIGWMWMLRWTLKIMAIHALIAHLFYLMLPVSIVFLAWVQQS